MLKKIVFVIIAFVINYVFCFYLVDRSMKKTTGAQASVKAENASTFEIKDSKLSLGEPIIIPPLWEELESSISGSTSRMKIGGGWLVKTVINGVGISTVYIPDPKHEWELKYRQEIHLK